MKAVKGSKEAKVIVATEAEKTSAAELLDAGTLLGEIAADYFGMVRDAALQGCSFEGMESAQPGLKALGAYRSAKSVIVNAKKQKKSLVNGDGSPKSKRALSEEIAPSGLKGKRAGKGRGGKGAAKTAPNKIDVIQAAFAILKAEPSMRRAYRSEIMETARMLANDDANKKPVVRVSAQRTALKGAADRQQAKAA